MGSHSGAETHPYTVDRILKEAGKSAGLALKVVADLSGHSKRVGAAQDLMAEGVGILPIMQAGGWKSTNVLGRYVQRAEIGLSTGQIDFEARESGARQSVAGNASAHDLPERSTVSLRNGRLRGKRGSDATYGD
jgi:hypothetical protein